MALQLKPKACLLELSGVKLKKGLDDNQKLTAAVKLAKTKMQDNDQIELVDAFAYYKSLNEISQLKTLSSKAKLQIESAKLAVMQALFSEVMADEPQEQAVPKLKKASFKVLCGLGLGFALAEGADGIGSLLTSIFLTPPMWLLVGSAAIFALLNVVIYFGFEMTEISEAMGVSLFDFASVMNTYYQQEQFLERVYQKIIANTRALNQTQDQHERVQTRQKLKTFTEIANYVKADMDNKVSKFMHEHEPSKARKAAKLAFGTFAATLFAADGFFIIKSFLGMFVSAAFLSSPVGLGIGIALALVFGVATCTASYWVIERVGTMNLIERFSGRPVDRQESLAGARERTNNYVSQLNDAIELDERRCAEKEQQADLRRDIDRLTRSSDKRQGRIRFFDKQLSLHKGDRPEINKGRLDYSMQVMHSTRAAVEAPEKASTHQLRLHKRAIETFIEHQKAVKSEQRDALLRLNIFKTAPNPQLSENGACATGAVCV